MTFKKLFFSFALFCSSNAFAGLIYDHIVAVDGNGFVSTTNFFNDVFQGQANDIAFMRNRGGWLATTDDGVYVQSQGGTRSENLNNQIRGRLGYASDAILNPEILWSDENNAWISNGNDIFAVDGNGFVSTTNFFNDVFQRQANDIAFMRNRGGWLATTDNGVFVQSQGGTRSENLNNQIRSRLGYGSSSFTADILWSNNDVAYVGTRISQVPAPTTFSIFVYSVLMLCFNRRLRA